MQLTDEQQQVLLETARSAIRLALSAQATRVAPTSIDPTLNVPMGCFVSLHDQATHRLRGCVGRLQSPDPLIRNVYETAVSVLSDPRFRNNPVKAAELARLTLEISVLSPLKPAAGPLDFEPGRHGIYLMQQGRAGTFLPQVARDTGWTREQLLARLCTEKMGLPYDAWQQPGTKLLTYEAIVIGPVAFLAEAARVGGFGSGNTFKI